MWFNSTSANFLVLQKLRLTPSPKKKNPSFFYPCFNSCQFPYIFLHWHLNVCVYDPTFWSEVSQRRNLILVCLFYSQYICLALNVFCVVFYLRMKVCVCRWVGGKGGRGCYYMRSYALSCQNIGRRKIEFRRLCKHRYCCYLSHANMHIWFTGSIVTLLL